MGFDINITKQALKQLKKAPELVQQKINFLVQDLIDEGPVQPRWPNYSKLGYNKYHCHLTYNYVACWYHEKNTLLMEVYYVGTRENAPY